MVLLGIKAVEHLKVHGLPHYQTAGAGPTAELQARGGAQIQVVRPKGEQRHISGARPHGGRQGQDS